MRKFFLLSAMFWAISAHAAIQYAGGTNVNAQCTASAGTKQELSDCIEDNLNAAGWTTISGHHTSTVLVESLTTPTASLQMRMQLTQGTNCVILKGRNVANTKADTVGQFLLPAVGKVYRVIANKYQYFISTDGAAVARGNAAGGVLYVPSFTGITEAIWTIGGSPSDTDTNVNSSFRCALTLVTPVGACTVSTPNYWVTVNGSQFESIANLDTNAYGAPIILAPHAQQLNLNNASTFYRWFDNSAFISEPLIGWCVSGTGCEGKVMGQLWDAAIITDSFASETALVIDSHNWLNWTNSITSSVSVGKSSLILVVP